MYKNLVIIISLPILTIGLSVGINNYLADNPDPVPQIHGMDLPAAQKMLFATADNCMNCHNNLVTPAGEDISFGIDWRASMMANSARDPYWHAAVRREVMDHPESKAAIENECSTCHMPMAHFQAKTEGRLSQVFNNLPANRATTQQNKLAIDGVSCTTCHQIKSDNFGERESFVGEFVIDTEKPMGQREIYGPYPVDQGRSKIMHSSSGFSQVQSKHLIESELCATCHTLYTNTLGPGGEVIGELPEQVPYLEWRHSSFVNDQSCQSCHMPEVKGSTPIASVWGQPRENVSKHTFRGGNFFMQRMLNRYRDDLGVEALPQEMDAAINRTIDHLQTKSAYVSVAGAEITGNELIADIDIENLAGHKLPTAYPSRRVWIRFSVTDQDDNVVFESGAVMPDGSIAGNDNDRAGSHYEHHYSEITREDQVQIYEAILVDPQDRVTTGLLTAIRYIKDNRILPKGFDKSTAGEDIAVKGSADDDADFTGGRDRVRYRVDLQNAEGPFQITAELYYQPIAYRWAQNLDSYDASETNKFVGYYNSMSEHSSVVLASAKLSVIN
ncbi:hypothetical protein [Rhodohalobacter sp. 8-1]|uniref:hypothetical protein n=1 Tax=Rhodohalobacter sp. 8-1 TaxID=3131972 RepID=UPI0030EF5E94